MLRMRGVRGGVVTDVILLVVFLVLAYIFLTRRGYMRHVDQVLSESKPRELTGRHDNDIHAPRLVPERAVPVTRDEKVQDKIDLTVSRVKDVRSDKCKEQPLNTLVPCSLILHFYDYSWHDLRYTLSSILQFTPDSLIREIIIVDDGSSLAYIVDEAVAYVQHVPKAVLLKSETQVGAAKARMRGAAYAMGANLVFIDSYVIVSPGWLGPLAEVIQREGKVIAVPHYDVINDPVTYEYKKEDKGLVPGFTWSMDITATSPRDYDVSAQSYNATVVRGDVFAITKDYFDSVGGLDEAMSEGGGAMLEFSLRAWQCGGRVLMLPCARVGVLSARDVLRVTSMRNVWRVAELWLGERASHVYSTLHTDPRNAITDSDKQSLESRRKQLSSLTCRDINWFLDNVAKEMYIPSSDVTHYGLLKIKNGRCMRVSRDDWRVDLGSCTPESLGSSTRDMTFELTRKGALRALGRCLTVQGSAYILAQECKAGDDKQVWNYDDKHRLKNKWSNYCALHVTDPDPKLKEDKRQIVMAQSCDSDSTKDKYEFSSWTFLHS